MSSLFFIRQNKKEEVRLLVLKIINGVFSKQDLDKFVQKGGDINEGDSFGRILLVEAAQAKNIAAIGLLLAENANVTVIDNKRKTALHWISTWDMDGDYVNNFIKLGAKPEARDILGRTPLHYAAKATNLGAILTLIHHGISVNTLDSLGNSPLHDAVLNKMEISIDVVTQLIFIGEKISQQNNNGETPAALILQIDDEGCDKIAKELENKYLAQMSSKLTLSTILEPLKKQFSEDKIQVQKIPSQAELSF